MRDSDEVQEMFTRFMNNVVEHARFTESQAKAVQYALAWVLDTDEPDELLTRFLITEPTVHVLDMVKGGFLDQARFDVSGLTPAQRAHLACSARLLAAICDACTAHEVATGLEPGSDTT